MNARAGYPLAPQNGVVRLPERTLERAEEDGQSVRNQVPVCQQPVSQPRHLRQRQVFPHRRYECSSANPSNISKRPAATAETSNDRRRTQRQQHPRRPQTPKASGVG